MEIGVRHVEEGENFRKWLKKQFFDNFAELLSVLVE